MRKLKERLGRPSVKPGILHQLSVRNYKYDGALHFAGSEEVANADGKSEFTAMYEASYGTTNFRGTSGEAPKRSINFNAIDAARAKQIKKQLDDAGFTQE